MRSNSLLNSLVRVPTARAGRQLTRVAPAGLLGLVRRRRRQPSVGWLAFGAVVAAAAAALLAPKRRKAVIEMLQRSGGGVGKQIGKFVGEQVGAHPVETAKLVQGTRDLVGSSGR